MSAIQHVPTTMRAAFLRGVVMGEMAGRGSVGPDGVQRVALTFSDEPMLPASMVNDHLLDARWRTQKHFEAGAEWMRGRMLESASGEWVEVPGGSQISRKAVEFSMAPRATP